MPITLDSNDLRLAELFVDDFCNGAPLPISQQQFQHLTLINSGRLIYALVGEEGGIIDFHGGWICLSVVFGRNTRLSIRQGWNPVVDRHFVL